KYSAKKIRVSGCVWHGDTAQRIFSSGKRAPKPSSSCRAVFSNQWRRATCICRYRLFGSFTEYCGLGDGMLKGFLGTRSEEHTSELQSRENLVCRLLLEKKKTTKNQ